MSKPAASQAMRSKDTVPVVQGAEHAILLTGTPALNRPKELFNQMSALVPAAKLSLKQFGERYCMGGYQRFGKYDGALCNLRRCGPRPGCGVSRIALVVAFADSPGLAAQVPATRTSCGAC